MITPSSIAKLAVTPPVVDCRNSRIEKSPLLHAVDRCGGFCHLHHMSVTRFPPAFPHRRNSRTACHTGSRNSVAFSIAWVTFLAADHMPHTAHHKFGIRRCRSQPFPVDLAFTYGHSFFNAGFFLVLRQLFFIALIFQCVRDCFYFPRTMAESFPVCHHVIRLWDSPEIIPHS